MHIYAYLSLTIEWLYNIFYWFYCLYTTKITYTQENEMLEAKLISRLARIFLFILSLFYAVLPTIDKDIFENVIDGNVRAEICNYSLIFIFVEYGEESSCFVCQISQYISYSLLLH